MSHLGLPLDPQTTWYPWNFAPLMAVSLFCGTGIKSAHWAFLLPLGIRAIGDFGIGLLTGNWEWAFPADSPLIYGCYVFTTGLGWLIRSKPQWLTAFPAALLGEIVFFVVTNFGVWWLGEGLMVYPPTLGGLVACYLAAIPFFGRSLLSTAIYIGALYSPVALRLAGVVPAGKTQAAIAN
jgi:hypothetical protein